MTPAQYAAAIASAVQAVAAKLHAGGSADSALHHWQASNFRLIDHLIVGRPAPGRTPYYSFREAGTIS